jgi:flagellar hook protein FlgE
MYSGVSGLRSQQSKLDVIGNNIANINTIGYKQQRVTFSDLLSQTISAATGADSATSRGGTNAKQIGLGVSVAATDTLMTTGSTQSTGVSTDLAIGGNGFFIVQGGGTGTYQFTRAGNFGVDASGNLIVNGLRVCGWQNYTTDASGNYTFNTQATVEPINLFSDTYNGNKKIIAPKATTAASLDGNLSPSDTASGTALNNIGTVPTEASATATMTVYDAQGNSYDVKVNLYKCYTDTGANTTSYYWQVDPATAADLNITGNSGYIEFDSAGNIITTDPTNYNTNPTINLTPQGTYAGAAAFSATLDFSGISYYTSTSSDGSSIAVSQVDGYASGELQDISIGSDGVILGVYSNDQKQPLGMVALANFSNPAGLQKIGSNLFITTANSGDFTGGVAAGTNGTGALSSGTLEMSNVDMAEQFSEMMITQRAYQANSKIISTADEMLQSVINMIR